MWKMLGTEKPSQAFFFSFILQALLVLLVTFYLFIYGSLFLVPAPAMVIASGSAGTWLFLGYFSYLIMVLYLGVTSFLYYQLEKQSKRATNKKCDWFAVAHYYLTNIGIIGACFLLMSAGYFGGAALLPASSGGGGLTVLQTHEQILMNYPTPVAAFIGVVMLGVFCGLVSYWKALTKR